jgi:sulfur carrier protein ThiS adenylyltransferase
VKISEIENHLKKFRVGIAGAGGLGSNCAAALARCGLGTLVIADFDTVESSNLSRQYFFSDQIGMAKTLALRENLLRIRPGISIESHQVMLGRENIPVIFSGCDIIVEAFDRAEMKEMIVETICMAFPETPLIIGSGLAGWGRHEKTGCRKVDEYLYICGDETTEVSEELPPLAPRVAIVANLQADTVIDILMKNKLT